MIKILSIASAERGKKKNTMEYIGKQIREDKRVTQEQLAAKSGVSRSIICGLETGRTQTTTTKTLFRIADALNVSINDLFSTRNA